MATNYLSQSGLSRYTTQFKNWIVNRLGTAAAKDYETEIDDTTPSDNLPTSAAVAAYVSAHGGGGGGGDVPLTVVNGKICVTYTET